MWLIVVVVIIAIIVIAMMILFLSPLRTVLTFNRHPIIYSEADIDRIVSKVELLRDHRKAIDEAAKRENLTTIDFRLAGADNKYNIERFSAIKVFLEHHPEVRNMFIYKPEAGMSQPPKIADRPKLIRYQLIISLNGEGICQAMIGGVYHDLREGSQTLFDIDVTHVVVDRGCLPLILVVDVVPEPHQTAKKIRRTLRKILGVKTV